MKKSFVFMFLAGLSVLFSTPSWAVGKVAPDLFWKFEARMDRLADRLEMSAGSLENPSRIAEEELKNISALHQEIINALAVIERELKRVSAKKTVKSALLGRHRDFVGHYRKNYAGLTSRLSALKDLSPADAAEGELSGAVSSLVSLIRSSRISRRQPLDPENLPVGVVTLNGTFSYPPQEDVDGFAAYLSETPGVMFSEEVEELAESLKENPIRLAQWVRDNVGFVPLYGSVKGSQLCLLDRSGSDYDHASLLIALLRYSDIPARYVYGRIEDENLSSWLGTESPQAAWDILKSHGVPVSDGAFEHVWVEAYIKDPSRWGIDGPPQWVPLDPSYKQYRMKRIARPVKGNLLEELSGTLAFAPADLVPGGQRGYTLTRSMVYRPVAIDLPYRVRERLWAGPSLGSEFTYRVKVTLSRSDGGSLFSGEFPVEELARQPVSLLYLPAGFQDRAIMKALDALSKNPDSPISFLPAYLIKVRPHLLVGGRIVLSGEAGGLGEKQELSVTLSAPRFKTKTFRHTVLAGSQSALRLIAGGMSRYSAFSGNTYGYTFKEKLLKEPLEYVEQKLGTAFLNRIGLDYLSKNSKLRTQVAERQGVVVNNFFSEGVVSRGVRSGYLMGRPASFQYHGVELDIQADLVCATYGRGAKNDLLATLGSYGSMLEHYVLENASPEATTAVSAMRVISRAQEEGVPVKVLHHGDEKLLSYLPQPLKSDISGALQRRQEVHIPARSVKIGDWEGYGYILIDPATGDRGYMINGLGAGVTSNVGAQSSITMPRGTLAKFLMVFLVLGVIVLIVLLV